MAKVCSKCRKSLDFSAFYSHAFTKDRLRAACKQCILDAEKVRRSKDSQYFKRYREKNLDRLREYDRQRSRNGRYKHPHAQKVQKEWRAKNAIQLREYKLIRNFGITYREYLSLCARQGNQCAICFKPETARSCKGGVKSLSVDHCHKNGKIRGLLCDRCNRGIGLFGDSIQRLEEAVRYLKGNQDNA